MIGPLVRVTGTALVIGIALLTPVLATATARPASADMVINGCTIVSNPTATNFTNCPGADLSGADLSGSNLSFANFAGAVFASCHLLNLIVCSVTNLAGANLSHAAFSNATLADCAASTPFPPGCGAATLVGANLTDANLSATFAACTGFAPPIPPDCAAVDLSGANLSDADLSKAGLGACSSTCLSADLTNANLTGTILVPANQSVTATSQAGAVATWATPAAIFGATPGICTPASGSTFPLFNSTVTCQVLDDNGDVATGTFQVNVEPTTQYFTGVLVPSDGAVLAGAPYLDAAAGDAPGVSNVVFELSGNALSDQVIATATPTLFGWVAKWNTTSVPNGTYTLQSVATDAANNTDTSTPISVTVNNQPPTTVVLIPSGGASLSGVTALLDASASSAVGIASVTFEVSGNGLTNQVIATGTPTLYGYLAQWNTTAVPNGTYTLQSVTTDTVAEATTSAPVSVTVDNAPPSTAVLIPSNGASQSGTAALLDASSSSGVTSVTYELTGGTLTNQVIATGTPTRFGWVAQWNTTTVPNGTYTLQSVAAYSNGVTGTSPAVTVTVANLGLADLVNSSFTVTTSNVVGSGCGLVHLTFDAVYPGSAAVGNVTLHIAGCVSTAPFTYTGSFTLTAGVGTLSGSATGPVTVQIIGGITEQSYQITLSVTTATGSFAGTTGSLLFSTSSQTSVASLTVE